MLNCKVTLAAALSLAGMALAGTSSANTYGGVGADVGVSTGQAGTTSRITGADMNERDETTGEGQSRADQMVKANQTDPLGQSPDTTQPESEAPTSGNNGGSGSDSTGMPQASSPQFSGEDEGQEEQE